MEKLKQQSGQDILIYGSCKLVNTLMQFDLIDEYRLLVYPVVVGNGKLLFDRTAMQLKLKFIDSKTFLQGVVLLRYEPERKAEKLVQM